MQHYFQIAINIIIGFQKQLSQATRLCRVLKTCLDWRTHLWTKQLALRSRLISRRADAARALSCLATPDQMSPQHLGAHVRAAKLGNIGARERRPTNTICPNGRGIKLWKRERNSDAEHAAFRVLHIGTCDVRERAGAAALDLWHQDYVHTEAAEMYTSVPFRLHTSMSWGYTRRWRRGGVFIDFAIAVLFGHKLLRRCHWGKCTCRCTILDNSLAAASCCPSA